MSKMKELIAMSDKLLAALMGARADIESLKALNATYSDRITEMEDEKAAEAADADAFIAKATGAFDAGGSTGGVVG